MLRLKLFLVLVGVLGALNKDFENLFTFGQSSKNTLILAGVTNDHTDTFHLVKVKNNQYEIESDSTYEIRLSNEIRIPKYYESDTLRIIDPLTFVNVYVLTPAFLEVVEAKDNLGELNPDNINRGQLYLIIRNIKYCIEKMEAFQIRDGKVFKIIVESEFDKEYAEICDIFHYLPIKKSDEFLITTCRAYDSEIGKKITVSLNLYFKIK